MEKYDHFLNRIGYQEKRLLTGNGPFEPNKGKLYPKVGENGSFLDFFGDTVIFDLDEDTRNYFSYIETKLYNRVHQCFSKKLDKSTFHMTLHDLSSSHDLYEAGAMTFVNEVKLIKLIKANEIKRERIKVRTNYLINMVNTSIVMALVPENEQEWNKLESLYRLIDNVKECPYPYLTPHVTIAYFHRSGFEITSLNALKKAVYDLNEEDKFYFELDTQKLMYKKFSSMEDYVTVFPLADI